MDNLLPDLGIVGLLVTIIVAVIYAILSGRLVPVSHVQRVQRVADEYKDAWYKAQSVAEKTSSLLSALTIVAATMDRVMNALPYQGEHPPDRSEESDDAPEGT